MTITVEQQLRVVQLAPYANQICVRWFLWPSPMVALVNGQKPEQHFFEVWLN